MTPEEIEKLKEEQGITTIYQFAIQKRGNENGSTIVTKVIPTNVELDMFLQIFPNPGSKMSYHASKDSGTIYMYFVDKDVARCHLVGVCLGFGSLSDFDDCVDHIDEILSQ